ncbi:hypothetical protein [Kitasatospora sp. GAS204B]|uniref:hypothetical protein n=1 Tax=unclassified Kitasatospora TaxID=2633591 RepID=UPI002474435D|nr:hypothetical protein [Kitasatospora sp. GAS204B]MDH6117186.1 hypothetical protein [Kitasatospora sp. GAS204B]
MNENESDGFRPDEFHHALDTELAALNGPPLGDVVTLATQRGRRQRRRRTVGAVTGSVTAVAVAASVLVGVLGSGPAHRAELSAAAAGTPSASATPSAAGTPSSSATPSAPGAPSVVTASPTPGAPSASAATSSGVLVPDSPAGLLDAVLHALPSGLSTDNYSAKLGGSQSPSPYVSLNVHTAQGTAQLEVAAFKSQYSFCQPGDWPAGYSYRCSTTPSGEQFEVVSNPAACFQHSIIVLRRHDGVDVTVWMPNCTGAAGITSPAVAPLTQEQALALAGTPAINYLMPASFVQAADAKYPDLPITK